MSPEFKKFQERFCFLGEWKPKFAWWPVRTEKGKKVWLKTVYVRSVMFKPLLITYQQYATLFDIMSENNEE